MGMNRSGRPGAPAWALWVGHPLHRLDRLVRPAAAPGRPAGGVAKASLPRPLNPPFQSVPDPFAVHALVGPLTVLWTASWIVMNLGLLVAAASLVVRFRRARGVEHQQLRWVALAVGLSATLLALLPLAIGAAILRYRLYDLDRIVSRTLTCGLLTLLLGGGHAVVALGLGQLLGRQSSLAVAAATRPWPPSSSRPAGGSRNWRSGASTAAATTPPRPSPRSAPACGTRSTWAP
jgi:hypothetical protein